MGARQLGNHLGQRRGDREKPRHSVRGGPLNRPCWSSVHPGGLAGKLLGHTASLMSWTFPFKAGGTS